MKKSNQDLPFSKRHGFEPADIPFQENYIDYKLRTDLWNAFYIYIYDVLLYDFNKTVKKFGNLFKLIWIHPFQRAIDDFPRDGIKTHVRNYIEDQDWYKVYDLFEFIFENLDDSDVYAEFEQFINRKLRSNNSAYAIVAMKFLPITNDTEIGEIKETQKLIEEYRLLGVGKHLNAAIQLFSQKPNPDFRNSIKESISMVEVISRIITPTESTLGKALNKLDKSQKINSSLKAGFEKLYAYTNDKNGIRHALMDDESVDFEDAKFFLVSCSAFTNYLIQKASKHNLL